jgi:diguanylate cyclase (GGDEF)-like protein
MAQGWIDFYVFVGLFILFYYTLMMFKSTAVYKTYLTCHLLAMMWSLSQFLYVNAQNSHAQSMLFTLSFVSLAFLAYRWLMFSLVLSRRMHGLSRAVRVWLLVPPIFSAAAVITNPIHQLFVHHSPNGERVYGIVLGLIFLYSVIYVTIATFLIIRFKQTQIDMVSKWRILFIIAPIILIVFFIFTSVPGSASIGLLVTASYFIVALRRESELDESESDKVQREHVGYVFDENQVEMILDVANQQLLLHKMSEKNRVLFEKNQQLQRMQLELSEVNRRLEQMSVTDDLTQCYNRRFFYQHLMREIDIEQRYQRDFSILLFDVDNFKKINDKFGHSAGDAILVGMTDLIRNTLRRSDVLARIGGEEFALYLPYTATQSALRMGERIRDIIEHYPFSTPKGEIHITVSMGLVSVEKHLDSIMDSKKFLEELLSQADEALYEAKEEGRNRIVVANRILDAGNQ